MTDKHLYSLAKISIEELEEGLYPKKKMTMYKVRKKVKKKKGKKIEGLKHWGF